ncbi:MAG: M6 family metalloprotease domain-containing protein, partial [Candidatus Zixiibacteriota bacterium]
GQLDIVTVNLPSTIGWTRAPQTYAYYVDGQRGIGTYPTNSQGLIEDLVDLVDGSVDFSQYDNDFDGDVDILLVIHSGTGAELSGLDTDIHSHKWSLPWPGVNKDGVNVYSYTIQPEFWLSPGDMTIGVYAHELCHGFGLPDLYDTDYSSNGIGDWGIMSFGSWNGPNNRGGSPAHPSAWSRVEMGFGNIVTVTSNMTNQAIAPVQTGGAIFRLPAVGGVAGEYFLVENRQQIGYDSYLPHNGLLIWHVDSAKADNTGEWWPGQPVTTHYKVALEQADGLWDIEHSDIYGNTGDMGDPFPGSSATTSFSTGSTPSSDSYTGGSSVTAVTNINEVGQTIFADLFMGVAAGVDDPGNGGLPQKAELSQNYPNPFNPTTRIEFWLQSGAEVELSVFNLLGRRVSTLLDRYVDAGQVLVEWDAVDDHGMPVASGIYFYTLKVDDLALTKKMALVR